jgi:hypothetical protein
MFGEGWHVTSRIGWSALRRFAVCAVAIGAGAVHVTSGLAQTRGTGPFIEVAAEIIVLPAVVTPFEIKVGRYASNEPAMLMIRGLPPRVSLSEGRSFSPGVWAVPLSGLGKLEMAPAHGTSGRSDLRIELVTLDGNVLAEKVSTLYILPAGVATESAADSRRKSDSLALTVGPIPGRPDAATGSTQTPASLGPSMAREVENARTMMRKGDENMESGKIAVARLFYKSAADSGYAPAALALGATYDSRQLAQWKVVGGQQADVNQARKWYEKARELGAPEADNRLRELGGG